LVAAHLARIIAESGQKTLLIDANWRKPSIDQALLEPNPGRGLASRLATINSEPESLIVLMLRPMAAISELNASLSIATAFQQLQSKYDCVVVDFHSTEHTADFEANMTAINEVIVVAEARRTSSETLLGFLRLIPSAKIAAVILNKV
jgi:Mrp family chromosome partitioning ATPase